MRSTVEGAAGVSERSYAVGAESHPSKNEGWGTRRFRLFGWPLLERREKWRTPHGKGCRGPFGFAQGRLFDSAWTLLREVHAPLRMTSVEKFSLRHDCSRRRHRIDP